MSSMPRQITMLVSVLAAGGGVLFGYDIGIISGALPQLKLQFSLSCIMQEMIVSSMLFGALLGSLVGGYFIDGVGRKVSIIISSVMYLTGAIILALSHNYGTLIVGRIVLGFAMALAAASECVYVSELTPSKIRGRLVSLNEMGITIGILVSYIINIAFSSNNENGWRYMFGLSSVGALIIFVVILLLPCSPRYLIMKRKILQAKKAFFSVRVHVTNEQHNAVIQEFDNIEHAINTENVAPISYCGRDVLYPAAIGVGLMIFQQTTGAPNVLFYAKTILIGLGFRNDIVASLGAVGLGVAKVIATILCLIFVDKFGRRVFLLIGCTVMSLSIFGLAIITMNNNVKATSLCLEDQPSMTNITQTPLPLNSTVKIMLESPLKWFSLILLMLFIGAYSVGFGSITWIILSEIFPVQIRGRLFSFVTSLNWAMNLLVSSTFLGFVEVASGLTWPFLVNMFLCVLSIFFVCLIIPETKGKSLEEIAGLWKNGLQCPNATNICCHNFRKDSSRAHLITNDESTL